jgi:hypothetical protein
MKLQMIRQISVNEVADLRDERTFWKWVVAIEATAVAHPIGDALKRSLGPSGPFV